MISITNRQGIICQTHREISPHSSKNVCYGKDIRLQVLVGMGRGTGGSFHRLLDTAWDHLGRERVSMKNGLDQ